VEKVLIKKQGHYKTQVFAMKAWNIGFPHALLDIYFQKKQQYCGKPLKGFIFLKVPC